MAPKPIRVLAVEVVILLGVYNERNLALPSRTGRVEIARRNVGDIGFYQFLHNRAMAPFLRIERISIAIYRTRLREILSAVLSVVSTTLIDQHRVPVIKRVGIAVHRLVGCFIIIPILWFKQRFRSTLRARRTIHMFKAEERPEHGDFFTRCVCGLILALTPWFRFFSSGATPLFPCCPHLNFA